MRKNGSRLISLQQYRLTDLFIFAIILVLAECLAYFAMVWLPEAAMYTFSLMIPITLIVMMRWGWPSIFFAVGSAVVYCALSSATATVIWLSYVIGNACIALLLIFVRLVGKERIAGKWYLSVAFVVLAWIIVNLGRSAVYAAFGYNFTTYLLYFFGVADSGLMSLIMAAIVILIMRRFDGIFEDQVKYLLRVDEERREKLRRDAFGDEPVEIDEETLSVLRKRDDDLY